ncbi:MAG TPA: hypothetical protein VNN09_14465 [Candidatus Competibacteraceae bacterium]|nr:hypothetical protein [Candidatus Competibacteraceae bacterium]
MPDFVLDRDHAAFIQGSVSISAASRSAAVLAELRADGAIAVVFSRASTHRTVQLKGTDAAVTALERRFLNVPSAMLKSFVNRPQGSAWGGSSPSG